MAELLVARRSGTVMLKGRRVPLRQGVTIAEKGSEVAEKYPQHFQPLRVHHPAARGRIASAVDRVRGGRRREEQAAPVEQATARPGEARSEVKGPDVPADPSPTPGPETPQRPPLSGPGSGVAAWRTYAATVTGTPAVEFESMSREDIITLLEPKADG